MRTIAYPEESACDRGKAMTTTNLRLTVKVGAFVDIDGPCRVTLIEVEEGIARLAFEAERSVGITRSDAKVRGPHDKAATA